MAEETFWNARKILSELCDNPKRLEVLTSFWSGGDETQRRLATAHLSRTMHFREETLRKAPKEKKAAWLASKLASPELETCFEAALMVYHTTRVSEMLGAFLDQWGIPHKKGTIEDDDYKAPTKEQVRAGVEALKDRFPLQDILLYLSSAGLLMGPDWRKATWPVVDEMVAAKA
ncbi:MAG TPA: hypothetical protein VHL58_07870 [Thermoanaerobaculia bacterium]|nr:hypothetical protein [Thermoanaerobaculia bacterium]